MNQVSEGLKMFNLAGWSCGDSGLANEPTPFSFNQQSERAEALTLLEVLDDLGDGVFMLFKSTFPRERRTVLQQAFLDSYLLVTNRIDKPNKTLPWFRVCTTL